MCVNFHLFHNFADQRPKLGHLREDSIDFINCGVDIHNNDVTTDVPEENVLP